MLKKHKKIIVLIGIASIYFILVFSLFKFHIVEYVFQRVVMANNPTVFFSCGTFGDEDHLNKIIDEKRDEKITTLRKYLSENNGDLYIEAVGSRCPNKFQFVAAFGGDTQRVEIEQILKDQTINGTPVFLLNR
ncbi:hypothetical protein IPJ91_01920 [bacterium]|nr:MAG: hypothetical protein IPJ91_01920 [bacterium]